MHFQSEVWLFLFRCRGDSGVHWSLLGGNSDKGRACGKFGGDYEAPLVIMVRTFTFRKYFCFWGNFHVLKLLLSDQGSFKASVS